jgi:hypothetical protein
MEIIPAIDIRGGKCVRLYQGDYGMETVFSDDPVGMAMNWQSLGAMRLHIVDLDGAASGELKNLDIISEIANSVLIPIEVGGGIRDMEAIGKLLAEKLAGQELGRGRCIRPISDFLDRELIRLSAIQPPRASEKDAASLDQIFLETLIEINGPMLTLPGKELLE